MAHAKLHNMEVQKQREDGGQSRSSKEVEAESVAYTVCQHFGIDTSDYSFAYVAGWSKGKEMPELKESLNTIRTAASELITAIEEKTMELTVDKEHIETKDDPRKDLIKDNPLKNAEMQVEDDYNTIDGIINNGSKKDMEEDIEKEQKSVRAKIKENKEKLKSEHRDTPKKHQERHCRDRGLC